MFSIFLDCEEIMAASRLEKIGNIFTRVQGLLKSGAMKPEDRPIFFDIYKAFPPLKEPTYCEPVDSNIPIRNIFYPEDKERAERDDSSSLFNLNEFVSSGRHSVSSEFINRTSTSTPVENQSQSFDNNQSKQKLFDMKTLNDLKE